MTYFTDNTLESGYVTACTKHISTFFKPFKREDSILGDVAESGATSMLAAAISFVSAAATLGHLGSAAKSLIIDQDLMKSKDELWSSAASASLAIAGGVLSTTWVSTAPVVFTSRVIATQIDTLTNCW
jgi:hypothetical protein